MPMRSRRRRYRHAVLRLLQRAAVAFGDTARRVQLPLAQMLRQQARFHSEPTLTVIRGRADDEAAPVPRSDRHAGPAVRPVQDLLRLPRAPVLQSSLPRDAAVGVADIETADSKISERKVNGGEVPTVNRYFAALEGPGARHPPNESGGGLDWTTRYRIIKGACEGLNYLHNGQEKPIYHLDLKPENILLDENMAPKIADFGLSRLFESTKTHITKTVNGTRGYMPPEFIDQGKITKKFDVFSLGVIIIQIIAGIDGYRQCCDMSSTQEFVDYVYAKWNKRVQGISRYASREADMLAVRQCIELSLRCVEANRDKRPAINDIIHQLNELDAEIENMFMRQPKSLLGQKSSESKYVGLDPVRELRFPFEVKKDISCCLQLTNQTDYFIAFNTKANQKKYSTQPNKGTIAPWSSCYVTVTMKAQETAPPYLQCHDMFVVQSTRVNEDLEPETEDITEELFKKTMGKVVDEEKLPIVYVALPQAES
ncbi:hypothetical protein OsJ_33613 [Oryza sativa Japonica Group]|uniref:Protein kinase domain-containing protein n=1 Tax=Oryza sativa subsp. japonica TaxID=39947 RepID=A3CAF4_ORYSJ|nr:hypothetical protein OsJ_33613 [Oryza sativa Japonica Group]